MAMIVRLPVLTKIHQQTNAQMITYAISFTGLCPSELRKMPPQGGASFVVLPSVHARCRPAECVRLHRDVYGPKRKHTDNGMLLPIDHETRQQKMNKASL
jgi:hypothetical protein